jgi:hypothetical protein
MAIDFSKLAQGRGEAVIEPRKIFTTLPNKKAKFSYLRDVQGHVLEQWFERRSEQDLVIKMNTGSGKTTVGLLALQSALNERVFPAVYIAPDRFLADQVAKEAHLLGVEVTSDEDDGGFLSGRKILVITVHKLLNGRSRFGVGAEGRKIEIGTLLVDDAHACLEITREQFKIALPSAHPAYREIVDIFMEELRQQSPRTALDINNGDAFAYAEVPFWAWQQGNEAVLAALHKRQRDEELCFSYPLIADVLPLCRCVIGGTELEIAPNCIPIDVIPSFAHAKRRIYMTATLSDDSVLVTAFNATPKAVKDVITPKSADDLGERMILIPQEVNPDIKLDDIKHLLKKISTQHNVVVIVPSRRAADRWSDISDQTLTAHNLTQGVERLRQKVGGVTVLVNKYDGIDLPGDACRVLVIYDLPEALSLLQRTDTAALDETEVSLRRQIQRIEQGMGRGIRSNEDHCVVLLLGARLSHRLHSPNGRKLFTSATQEQLKLSDQLTDQLRGAGVRELGNVIGMCLNRDAGWIQASKRALLNIEPPSQGTLEPSAVALRRGFNLAQLKQYPKAVVAIQDVVNQTTDSRLRGWLKVRLAEVLNFYDRSQAQEVLLSANGDNRQVIRPLAGVGYQKISASQNAQVATVMRYRQERFLEHTDFLLWMNEVSGDLQFTPDDPAKKFEKAMADVARVLGFGSQRPETDFRQGPDVLWALDGSTFFVIECKSCSQSDHISKTDIDQLSGSLNWFRSNYGTTARAVPILIHPRHILGRDATPPEGTRVIPSAELSLLRDALASFAQSLSAPNVLENPAKVRGLLQELHLNGSQFLGRYTRLPVRRG